MQCALLCALTKNEILPSVGTNISLIVFCLEWLLKQIRINTTEKTQPVKYIVYCEWVS